MKKPILVVMAAGMGSRYGGLKQMDPIGENGEIIMDYSLFDAVQAGFEKVVFVIKKELMEDFKQVVGNKASENLEVHYAFQELSDIPGEFNIPEGRQKPWGTGHAVLAARKYIDAPFAVINADDYYGAEAFKKIYEFLSGAEDTDKKHFAMVGYNLMNTLSEHGHVARGVCSVDSEGMLIGITERTKIENHNGCPQYTEDDGRTWESLPENTVVSMNMWGFTESMVGALKNGFIQFLRDEVPGNPMKSEFFLPFVVNDLLHGGEADVKVLASADKWFGVTYKEDKPVVIEAVKRLTQQGVYPSPLWEK